MKFLQQLDEAANIPVEQLKDKMKKDPRVKMVFQRELNVDELKSPDDFIRTLRYYLFSNPQVRAYVDKRADVRNIGRYSWQWMDKTLRPGVELKQDTLITLMSIIKDLFKDVGQFQKQDVSTTAVENFHDWYQRQRTQLHTYSARELDSLGLKPSKAVRLYRGFLFNERSFEERSGLMSGGEAIEFLRSIREGTRVIDLKFDKHSVWTTDKDEAIKRAIGLDKWAKLTGETERKVQRYQGLLGFVVSTLAQPKDVLLDLSQTKPVLNWPGEGSADARAMVLKPGDYLSRVVHKFTPEGEEDPTAKSDDADLDSVKSQLSLLGRILKLPFPTITFTGVDRNAWSPEAMSQVGILLKPEVQEATIKLLKQVTSYYNKHLAKVDVKKVASQAGENSATFAALKEIHELFSTSFRHQSFPLEKGRRGAYGSKDLKDMENFEELLTAQPDSENFKLADAASHIASQKRWTDWRIGSVFRGFAKIADPSYTPPDKIHLSGWKVQKVLVDKAMDGFYTAIGKTKPESYAEQAKEFVQVLNKANAVAQSVHILQKLKAAAQSVDA